MQNNVDYFATYKIFEGHLSEIASDDGVVNGSYQEAIANVPQKILDHSASVEDSYRKSIAFIPKLILDYAEMDAVGGGSDVSGAMINHDGFGVTIHRDRSLKLSVAKSKLVKAEETVSQDLEKEWGKSMGAPIKEISAKFATLKTCNKDVVVTPRVPLEDQKKLHDQLAKIDPAYDEGVSKKEHLHSVPKLVAFMKSHCVVTPYSFDIRKGDDVTCCGEICTPDEFRELAMQRQPTPIKDPKREGHFYGRSDALAVLGGNDDCLIDLSDLPSFVVDEKKRDKAKRDREITKELGLKSWDSKRVRCFLVCYNCGKRRCVYSPRDDEYVNAITAMQQKLESVSGRFSCGDLLFPNNHHLSKVIVQKQNLTCESAIEKGYYNNEGRALKY